MSLTSSGFTFALGTSTFNPLWQSMTPDEVTRAVIGVSHLEQAANSALRKIPGKLINYGSIEFVVVFDPNDIPPIDQDPETLTITFPLDDGESAGATLAGTGFFSGYTPPELADIEDGDEGLQKTTIVWEWDGMTGPTWTDAT